MYQYADENQDDLGSLIGDDISRYDKAAYYKNSGDVRGKSQPAKSRDRSRDPNADNLRSQVADDGSQYNSSAKSATQKKSKSRSKGPSKQDVGSQMQRNQYRDEYKDDLGSLMGDDASRYDASRDKGSSDRRSKSQPAKRGQMQRNQYNDQYKDDLGSLIGDDASQFYDSPKSPTQKKNKPRSNDQSKQDVPSQMQRSRDDLESLIGDDVSQYEKSARNDGPSDRRGRTQPAKLREKNADTKKSGFALGPDTNLAWDAGVSMPTRTAARSGAGYGGHVPGVYGENVIGLGFARSAQKGAHVLNNLERNAEDERAKNSSKGQVKQEIEKQMQRDQYNGNDDDLGSLIGDDVSPGDRRNKSQPARSRSKNQDSGLRLAHGPDTSLAWNAGVSPPTVTAARAMPGYGGHVPGVYSENVIGLVTPLAGQNGAYKLNILEAAKERELITEGTADLEKNLSQMQRNQNNDENRDDLGSLIGDNASQYNDSPKSATQKNNKTKGLPNQDDGSQMVPSQYMDEYKNDPGNLIGDDLSDAGKSMQSSAESFRSALSAAASPRSPKKRKSKSQPGNKQRKNSDWQYVNGKKVYANAPDKDLKWDGPVSPTSRKACAATPGYGGHKPGVYSENIISLVDKKSTQRAAQVLNDMERFEEGSAGR